MERFLDYFVPEKYQLEIGVNKFEKKIGGTAKIIGEAVRKEIKFHVVGLTIKNVLVNESGVKFKCENDVLVISDVPKEKLEVTIAYIGDLNENMEGAYLSTYDNNGEPETIVATQFESHYAREAFPCIDEPAAKAVFDLSLIVSEVKDEIVLANTPISKTEKTSGKVDVFNDVFKSRKNDVVKYTFEPTPRMSTYLLAWVIGKFHGKTIRNKHGVEITSYCALNQDVDSVDFANEIAARSLEFYDDNFKVKYPLRDLKQVALPDFEAGAMENWGLVTYRESMMLAGRNATLGTRKSVALTVAHELSHQWFGDLVTMKWWDDLWLNESFASIMEYYAVDAIHPEYKIFEGFFTGDSHVALMRDAYTDVQSVHQEVHDPAEIATLFDGAIVYSKGARLMLMLIRLMGWKEFCEGVADYFEKFKYDNTEGDDLWASLRPYAEFDPAEFMHSFIDRPGYPVIMEDGSQKRFVIDGTLKKEEWPLPEITEDMSGHYVIDLPDAEFKKRLQKFDKLSLEEKIRLLIDRGLITKTELASSDSLLPLLKKFTSESSAAVWNIIVSIISNLKIFFEYDSPEEKQFKKFVGDLIRPKLDEIGLVTRENDDENMIRLRAILLGLDYYAENRDNLAKLAKMFSDKYEEIDAEIREDIFDAKIYVEPEMVDKFIADYARIADPEVKFELLFAGTLSKNAKVLGKVIKLLDQPEVVKPQDQLYLFVYLYRNPVSREKVFEWMKKNWDYLRKVAGDKSLENYPRYTANVIRSEADYKAWKDFFDAMRNDSALSRAITIGEKEIKARLKLIRGDADGVYRVLGELDNH